MEWKIWNVEKRKRCKGPNFFSHSELDLVSELQAEVNPESGMESSVKVRTSDIKAYVPFVRIFVDHIEPVCHCHSSLFLGD